MDAQEETSQEAASSGADLNLEGFTAEPGADGDYAMTDDEKKKLLAYLNKDHADTWRSAFQMEARRRWAKTDDYDAGRQALDRETGDLVGHELAGAPGAAGNIDDKYSIFNVVGRISLSNIERMSNYQIQPNVTPNSSNPKDKAGARAGRIALSDMFTKLGEEKFKRRAAVIANKYGSVFFKTFFDPTRGRLIHPLKQSTLDGSPEYDTTTVEPEGEVVIIAVSPENVLLPMHNREFEYADWLEEVHVETINFIWRNWKVKIEAESIEARTGYGPENSDLDQRDIEYQSGITKNSAVVKSRYINPCPEFSRGAIIVYTKKHILRCTDLLTYFDSIQEIWSCASVIGNEKSPYGKSPIWDIIPIQDALNTTLSAINNYVEGYGLLQAQASTNANIKLDKISNGTLRIFSYQGEKGLEPIEHAPLPPSHMETFNVLQGLSESLGAAHDIRRATQQQSGNAIVTLQQIDDSILRPAIAAIGEAIESSCTTALKLMGEYYTNPRLQRLLGKQGWEIQEDFTGEMLNGNYNARISLINGLSTNPSVRMEQVLKLSAAQLVDPLQAQIYLEMGNTDDLLEALQKQNEIADRIVTNLADYPSYYNFDPVTRTCTGSKVVWHMWDNHQVIIDKMTTWMQENFDHADPDVQKAFTDTLEWHQKVLAAMTMPPPPGAGAPADGMTPHGGQQGPPTGPGQAPPKKEAGNDSRQHPSQQPDRSKIPNPPFTGLAQV